MNEGSNFKEGAAKKVPGMKTESEPKISMSTATPDDAKGIRELEYETYMETYVNDKSKITRDDIEWYFHTFKKSFTPQSIEKLAREIENLPGNQYVVVAKNEEGDVVGFAWSRKGDINNDLGAIYVSPKYQGAGLGKKIWTETAAFFDPEKETILTVQEDNAKAIEFYKKLGFVDTGKRTVALTFPSGIGFNEIEMLRKADLVKL